MGLELQGLQEVAVSVRVGVGLRVDQGDVKAAVLAVVHEIEFESKSVS